MSEIIQDCTIIRFSINLVNELNRNRQWLLDKMKNICYVNIFHDITCKRRPAFALGTIVTMGIRGLNLLIFIDVKPVLEITIMQAAERFFEASATAYTIRKRIKLQKILKKGYMPFICDIETWSSNSQTSFIRERRKMRCLSYRLKALINDKYKYKNVNS